ncbi:Transcriptional regulatory protein sin3 [Puccinia graminis f. sp. tritici]|uniref:Transcriptional regulatory protein sin3 n=2 Tax=Puccinia graminis f. sp. tritici TaxID=56615 RepID=A0A5B0PXK7_PUCGR|nr:Transcriptional regulatory protein sin3 [Puccinia graminis f. sp. tritici]
MDAIAVDPVINQHAPTPTPTNEHPISSRAPHSIQTNQIPPINRPYNLDPSNTSKLLIAPDLTDPSKLKTSQPKPIRPNSTLIPGVLQPQPNLNTKPVEFNYAINYVNKIKHRFIDQPEIYKTFLEILQTYQRDGMPIDSVYVKVTKLFSNAADLLDEFKQFLPDLNASSAAGPGSKSPFPPPPVKASSSTNPPPNTSPQSSQPSSSTRKPSQEKLPNSQFLPHHQPLYHLKPSHRPTPETSNQHKSPSILQNNPSTDPNNDTAGHLTRLSPTRLQSPSKVHSHLARVASPAPTMLLDPQVLSSTTSGPLDPQVLNSGLPNSQLPPNTGSGSMGQSNNGFIAGASPARTSVSHLVSSTVPDHLPPYQKRLLASPANAIPVDDDFPGPPKKKRALGNGNLEEASLRSNKDQSALPNESYTAAFQPDDFASKKIKRSKSKTSASAESMPPAVTNEAVQHRIATFLEQYRSSQPESHEATNTESAPHNFATPSEAYRNQSQSHSLPHQVIDPSIGGSSAYAHPHLQLVHDPHLGSSNLAGYSTCQPSYVETHDAMGGRTLTNTKEVALFESIRKFINDPDLWLEFLRVLDLYNRSIIDFKTLLDRVSVFIGDDDELLEDFKGLVGYDVKNDGLVEGEVWEIRNTDIRERDKVDASTIQKEYGPSYKRLPRAEIDLACSGRDELCWSVLNDEYFGAAKFGTESGGPGHRKTNFEEVVAMTEGERAHFSYWLECISRTIGHLECLRARIDGMEDRDKASFTLGDNLGGSSPSIYHRTLRKVYESKYQSSILPYLRDYPANTIPIVLHRLKELELSWKSAESQWNLIWREVERKNYYKAQDHQVITFKSNEKSLLKGQNLLKEIHDLKKDQKALVYTVSIKADEGPRQNPSKQTEPSLNPSSRMDIDKESVPRLSSPDKIEIILENRIPRKIDRSPTPLRAAHQIELGFEDMEVFYDVLRIIIMALDRSALSNPERRRIDESLRTFIPAVWNISAAELEKQIPIIYDDESSEPSEYGRPTLPNHDVSTAANQQNVLDQKGIETLTEGLLKIQTSQESRRARSQNLDTPMSSPQQSYQLTPAEYVPTTISQPAFLEPNGPSFTGLKKWTKLSVVDNHSNLPNNHPDAGQPADRRVGRCYNVFGSSTYYLLVRLLHTLYMRLMKLKTIGVELGKHKPRWRRINPVAIELGLSHSIIGLDDHPNPASQLYPYCLDQLSRYFDGEIDFNSFEESIRVAFPRHGYLLSTVDKLTNSILKQFAQIHQEPKNKELLNLLNRERILSSISPITQISYRHQAESILEEEEGELFRAEWHPERMSLSFQILNQGESTFEVKTATEKLTHYVDTYEFETSTELIDPAKVRRPFLRSNLLIEEENSEDEENGEEEGEQEVEEGKETAGEDEHDKSMSTDGRSGAGDQAQKEKKRKKRAGRVVLVNSNKIRLSIDAETYKLQFNNRRNTSHQAHHHHHYQQTNSSASSSSSRPTNLQAQLQDHEPTDLLVVKDFSLAAEPADLGFITNLQNRKFLAWLTNRQSELNELNQAV